MTTVTHINEWVQRNSPTPALPCARVLRFPDRIPADTKAAAVQRLRNCAVAWENCPPWEGIIPDRQTRILAELLNASESARQLGIKFETINGTVVIDPAELTGVNAK